jgi:hypothetical protein
MTEGTWWEKVEAKGGEIVDKVKEIVEEGNVRRVRIKQKDRVIAEFPLTLGVGGVLLAPVVAAIATIAALVTDCTLEVERAAHVTPEAPKDTPQP